MKVSFRPSNFTEGGSLLDDVDVTVKEAKFLMHDYDGKTEDGMPKCILGLVVEGPDGKDEELRLSTGKNMRPSDDGETHSEEVVEGDQLASTDGKGLNGNCNFAKFLESLVMTGYPEQKLDNLTANACFVGLQFHLKRVAVQRQGLIRTGKNANREQTVVTCSKIIKLPWDGAKGQAAKPAPVAAKANGKAESTPNVDLNAIAQEQVMGVLLEHGPTTKAKLATLVFQAMKGDPNQKAVSQLVVKDEVLKGIDGVEVKAGVVSVAA